MLVSVYIPTKGRAKLLERAVNSVIEQTYTPIEIVVCVDGPDDHDSVNLLDSYISKGYNLKYIVNEKSIGACCSRNNAISLSAGEFITGLDDDDIMHKDRISTFIDCWDPKYAYISSKSMRFNSNYSWIYKFLTRDKVFSANQLLSFNYAGNQIFTLKSTLDKFNFDEDLPALQDWELWFRILKETGLEAKRLGRRTQFMDVSHGEERISNFERRLTALSHICNKHSLHMNDFEKAIVLWKLEFSIDVDKASVMKSIFSTNFIPTIRNLLSK